MLFAKPLSIFEWSQRTAEIAEIPEESQCHFRKSQEREPRELQTGQSPSIPGKMMEELILHCYL